VGVSLYERIGGEHAIASTVIIFYERVLADGELQPFFAGISMDRQIQKQIAFMTMAFGGPHHYTGRDLRTAHAHLVAAGLNRRHFELIVAHLRGALTELRVPQDMIGEAMAVIAATQGDVLGG
jgi:hemoglobin